MILPFVFSTSLGEQISIDRATVDDCIGVAEVKKSALLDSYAAYIDVTGMLPLEVPEKYHWLLQDRFKQELAFHVARDASNAVLGFVIAMPRVADQQLAWRVAWVQKDYATLQAMIAKADSSVIWIDQLFVSGSARNKGIGRKLLQSVVSRFSRAHKMQLYVGEFNKTAIAFYERVGFKKLETSIAQDAQGNDRVDLYGDPLYHSLMEIDLGIL